MDNWLLKYFHYLREIVSRVKSRQKRPDKSKLVTIVAFSALFLARVFHVSFTGNGQNTKREVCQSINDNYSSLNTYAQTTHAPTLVLARMTNREPSPSSISNAQLRWLWGANFFSDPLRGNEVRLRRIERRSTWSRPNTLASESGSLWSMPPDDIFSSRLCVRDSSFRLKRKLIFNAIAVTKVARTRVQNISFDGN